MSDNIEKMKQLYKEKFAPINEAFTHIHRGDHIFIGTACGEPQFLVNALVEFVKDNPKAFFDTELLQVWSLGVAPYTDSTFHSNFRLNSFFIGDPTRDAVNEGMADYTPLFLSQTSSMFKDELVPIDVALIQVSLPDPTGHVSLGVSVDITKAAVEKAELVIAQVNRNMPRVLGDSFLHIEDIDYLVVHHEPLLVYEDKLTDEISAKIGSYVSKIVQDGDTIQVGYGSIPNSVISNLKGKKHLGVHTELISDGIVELMKARVVDNSLKTLDRGKTVASFCMGTPRAYEFIHDNPDVEFKPIEYTNNPLNIARQRNMVAINSTLQIDLTGQSSAESIGHQFYSGIGGHADFMRGAVLAPGGTTILCLQSTADNGNVSRIVPFLSEGAGATLTRGDIHYVVTEYGIAYLHGKNIRERAMELISIAHPKFRSWLIKEAKKYSLIYKDQAFIPGKRGEYPEELETYKTTEAGMEVFLRPVKISDEPLLKDFFYHLSDQSMYKRFISARKDMPHERLQEFVIIDYT
ncbi:MAG TPA: acetyl-CoA hydrolase/transferase family protein, partial [Euryarchaeota archaeon]|nr:acetyl-CoA hydrolase/transferase family protein [Euryarchaeota archaeon]